MLSFSSDPKQSGSIDDWHISLELKLPPLFEQWPPNIPSNKFSRFFFSVYILLPPLSVLVRFPIIIIPINATTEIAPMRILEPRRTSEMKLVLRFRRIDRTFLLWWLILVCVIFAKSILYLWYGVKIARESRLAFLAFSRSVWCSVEYEVHPLVPSSNCQS